MKTLRAWFFVCFALCFATSSLVAGPFTQLVDFGDSLSDTGNYFHLTGFDPPPPYYNGHFSNGPVWVEQLAPKLGLATPTPSHSGGTDFAYGGATAADVPGFPSGYSPVVDSKGGAHLVPTLGTQVNTYLAGNGGKASPTALYTVLAGANDIFDAIQLGYTPQPVVAADAVKASVQALLAGGAKTVLVSNLPALGQTPLGLNSGISSTFNALTDAFNGELSADLDALQAAFPKAKIDRLDLHALLTAVQANPGAYGFVNATDEALPLYVEGKLPDPNTYLFWDGIHPTSAGHTIIAQYGFSAAVPEPSSLVLLCIATSSLTLWRRRHNR